MENDSEKNRDEKHSEEKLNWFDRWIVYLFGANHWEYLSRGCIVYPFCN